MIEAIEVTETVDLSAWAPGTRMFSANDGKHFLVDADISEYPDGPIIFVRRQTSVLYCESDGRVTDLVPDHIYPPGTTPEAVLLELDYSLSG